MYLDRKAFMLEFFAYQYSGACIANVGAVTRMDFTGTYSPANTFA